MSHWDYRILRRKTPGKPVYGLFECTYDDNGEVVAFTHSPLVYWYETPQKLIESLEHMYSDASKFREILSCESLSKT